jgi:phospholipase/lecithinase/hemolysin
MIFFSLRRAVVVAACASAALLSACGSSTVESQVTPARFIAFGDAFADVGQAGSKYTVNDGFNNNWITQMAAVVNRTITPSATGGLGYGRANVRVVAKPDAVGSSTSLTVKEQIDTFLTSNTMANDDIIVVSGGISDIVVEMASFKAGTTSQAQFTANVQQAGRDLGAQVRRVVTAGGKHVMVVGPYNLGNSPWARALDQKSLLTDATTKFNEALLVSINDLGANVLYVDAAYYYNLVVGTPAGYSMTNVVDVVCTSVDAGAGIGVGAGEVNSSLCNTSTILSGTAYDSYLFADKLYFSPAGNRLFGNYAYDKLRDRW